MTVERGDNGLWFVVHDGLLVGRETIEEAIEEYGNMMELRGRSEASTRE